MGKYCMVMTTFDSAEAADKLIESVLKNRLAACVQTTDIQSRYIWKGEVCNDKEILTIFKTTWKAYDGLKEMIANMHPYETPELIVFDIDKGSAVYLSWIDEITG